MAKLTPTKGPDRAVTGINEMPLPTPESPKRPINPYSLKRSKKVEIRITDFPAFIKMLNGYVNIILTHDPGQRSTAWFTLWQQWVEDDLLEATTFHMVSVVVDFPPPEKSLTNRCLSSSWINCMLWIDIFISRIKQR